MRNKIKDISIKNYTCYFFNDIINTKIFDPIDIKIDARSCKNILIYYIEYVTIKDSKCVKINNVNLLLNPLHNINSVNLLLSIKWIDTFKKLMKISI